MNITPIAVDLWNLRRKSREIRINICCVDVGDVSGSLLDIWYCGTGSWGKPSWNVSLLYHIFLRDLYYKYKDKFFPENDVVEVEVPPAPTPVKKGKGKKKK